ncbi:hypothetical protein [Streptomyces sp. NPDC088554]|uniref:hypothetical protein n=1 Tax=Streptomyces sp. NPDC088554 TaxID=3365865 RepID=UPI003820A166
MAQLLKHHHRGGSAATMALLRAEYPAPRSRTLPGKGAVAVSLTSQISAPDSPFAMFASRHLPRQRTVMDGYRTAARAAPAPQQPAAPTGTTPAWGTIGAAIDHRLRYAFTCRDIVDGAVRQGIEYAASLAVQARRAEALLAVGADLVAELAGLLERERPDDRDRPVLLEAAAEERLDRLCVAMVWFEEVYRSGVLAVTGPLARLGAGLTLSALLAEVPGYVVRDLEVQVGLAQHALAGLRAETSRDNCHSGPTFAGSRAVGGADADLIAGGLLVDFKALKDPVRLAPSAVYQLAGYALLDFEDRFGLDRVGLYLTRSGQLITWGLEDFVRLLGAGLSVPALRASLADSVVPGR